MKCPICGEELRPGKKNPDYLLCYNCKKKYKVPQSQEPKEPERKSKKSKESEEQKYGNIPPKRVRDKREEEMRKAYDEMLAVGDGKSKKKKTKDSAKVSSKKYQQDYDYDDRYDDDYGYDDDYDYDEKVSKAPIIVLALAIVVVAAVIAYLLFLR